MGPLKGVRVVELASIGPGPFCGMLLADMGADVVRIDRLEPSGLGVPVDPRFEVTGRNRRSLALDLKSPAAVEAVLRLVSKADLLIEGYRPGVAERLGLGPQDCHARNPALVYGRMTGFGQTGPLAQAAGHDMNYIALTGALHAIGPNAKPTPPLNLVGDYGGGALYLALGLLAALHECKTSGRGQVVDAAMVDGAASLASIFFGLKAAGRWKDGSRNANLLDGGAPFYDTYETADGLWVSLGPLEPKFFAELVQRLGLDASFIKRQYDTRVWPELRQAIATAVQGKTRAQWCEALEGTDVCFAPVLTFEEAPLHAHAAQRQAFIEVGGVTQPAPAPRFDRTPSRMPTPAPVQGAHSQALLREAGYSEAEIQALLAQGAVKQA
jgi:alpha-methylacyl-CoA racemase